MSAFTRAAYVSKTRNMHGSVVCTQAGTLPFLLQEGQTVHFVPPTLHGPRSARVSRVVPLREGSWEVSFDGIASIDKAEQLCACYCLVAHDELAKLPVSETPALLIGFAVEDAQFGPLGEIDAVQESSAQAVLTVVGTRGEVLVPFVDQFIEDVDGQTRTVRTRIPEGLLALNAASVKGDDKEGNEPC